MYYTIEDWLTNWYISWMPRGQIHFQLILFIYWWAIPLRGIHAFHRFLFKFYIFKDIFWSHNMRFMSVVKSMGRRKWNESGLRNFLRYWRCFSYICGYFLYLPTELFFILKSAWFHLHVLYFWQKNRRPTIIWFERKLQFQSHVIEC